MKNTVGTLGCLAALALSSAACSPSLMGQSETVVTRTIVIVQSGGIRTQPTALGAPQPEVSRPEPARLQHEYAGPLRATVFAIPPGFNDVSQLGVQQPVIGTFTTDEIDVAPREVQLGFPNVPDRDEWFGVRYEGRMFVDVAGRVLFRLLADDGAKLYIDGEQVVDNNGIHAPLSQMGVKTLQTGFHSIRVDYFQGPRLHFGVQLFWIKADAEREELFTTK